MQNIRVFISRDIPENGIALLRDAGFQVTVWPHDRPMTQAELIAAAKQSQALLSMLADQIDAHFLHECRRLDLISQYAVGYNNIDVAEATRLGIAVGNTPDVLSDATADVAFGLMIAAARKMFYLHKTIARGEWGHFRPKAHLGFELKHKTLGIFGLGRIGMEMARRCKGAYGMEVIYHNRRPNPEAEALLGARYVSFDDLLRQSDILSVHSVLSDETRGIFDKTAFEKMKPTAVFINTARGPVHREDDLIEALQTGRIWGAGLDVTDPEPMHPGNPLLSMENVAVLPHIGSATVEARGAMARLAAENIIGFYRDKKPPHLVNQEVMR